MFADLRSCSAAAGPIANLGSSTGVLDSMYHIELFGKTFNIIGYKGFFLGPSVYDCGVFALFLFQMVFMDTTATIPTGTMAERWKFSSFILYGCAIGTVMYPVYGCWMWGGGWLSQLGANFGLGHGAVDFAGSSVVHMQGGVIALVGGWLVGPRLGKYNKDGSINPMPPHNIPMAILGTFILAFGWFGFNPGSTLSGTDDRIAIVATNTMLASATGAMATYLWMVLISPDEAGSEHVVQRHVGGPGCDHRAVCLCALLIGLHHRPRRWRTGCGIGVLY